MNLDICFSLLRFAFLLGYLEREVRYLSPPRTDSLVLFPTPVLFFPSSFSLDDIVDSSPPLFSLIREACLGFPVACVDSGGWLALAGVRAFPSLGWYVALLMLDRFNDDLHPFFTIEWTPPSLSTGGMPSIRPTHSLPDSRSQSWTTYDLTPTEHHKRGC